MNDQREKELDNIVLTLTNVLDRVSAVYDAEFTDSQQNEKSLDYLDEAKDELENVIESLEYSKS